MALQTDLTAVHARALGQAAGIVAGIGPDQLSRPTPCPQWTARDLVNHVVGVNWAFTRAGRGETVERTAAPQDLIGDEPATAYDASAQAVRDLFAEPGVLERTFALPVGELPGSLARNVHVVETVIHSWDLATATGQADRLDTDLAEAAEQIARAIVQPSLRNEAGHPFAAEVAVTDGAPPYQRLAGFLGRRA
jgi:uncharacterized protein (TIGR03086 family)